MPMGSIIGVMLAASFGAGLHATHDFAELQPFPVYSPAGGGIGSGSRSPGTRARRRWKRTRAAGITARRRK